jgi:hypothetical protein
LQIWNKGNKILVKKCILSENSTYFLAFHGCVGGVLGKFCQEEGLLAGNLACFELFGHNNPQSGVG